MKLKEEVADILNNRPSPEDAAEGSRYKRKDRYRVKAKRRLEKPFFIVLLVMATALICLMAMMIVMNILPLDLTLIVIAFMAGLIVAAGLMFTDRRKPVRAAGALLAAVYIVFAGMLTVYMSDTFAMFKKISGSANNATGPAADSVDVVNEPFNIYITGIDQWEDEKGEDLERSDVNMIMTVNPVTKKILLTSIPRDTYVKLHTAQQMDKLTHTGIYGVGETLSTVEDWMGVDMNYYVKLNFTGIKRIINAMEGIRVYSPVAFKSSISEFEYDKGWNNMYGRKALYFARERHAFEGKDSIRVENQQRVVKAVIKKMTSSTTLLTKYGDIMAAAGDNLQTNMSPDDMTALVKLQMGELAEWDVESQKIDGEYDQDYVASLTQSMKFDVYRADPASVRSCTEKIREVMDPDLEELNSARKDVSRSFVVNVAKRMLRKEDA